MMYAMVFMVQFSSIPVNAHALIIGYGHTSCYEYLLFYYIAALPNVVKNCFVGPNSPTAPTKRFKYLRDLRVGPVEFLSRSPDFRRIPDLSGFNPPLFLHFQLEFEQCSSCMEGTNRIKKHMFLLRSFNSKNTNRITPSINQRASGASYYCCGCMSCGAMGSVRAT